jgi:hypothetical protein
MKASRFRTAKYACPCCRFVTLQESGAYEICVLCWWEDDGQDEARADEVWGGPNADLSLAQARANFRQHLVMYAPSDDRRIGGHDSPEEQEAKRALMAGLAELAAAGSEPTRARALEAVEAAERRLDAELERKIAEWERGGDGRCGG